MKAIDYFKKYGLAESKKHLVWMAEVGARMDVHGGFMNDLKRLVESHELVERLGGLDAARNIFMCAGDGMHACRRVSKAIADAESCQ